MAKSGWRGSGGASDGRIDLAPRKQRRLERKRAIDKRHLNYPKAWAYVVDFFVATLSAKRFRNVLAAGPAPPITEKIFFFFFLFRLRQLNKRWAWPCVDVWLAEELCAKPGSRRNGKKKELLKRYIARQVLTDRSGFDWNSFCLGFSTA